MSSFVSEFEWQASNAYRFYPFADRSEAGGADLRGVIVDALVVSPSTRVELTHITRVGGAWAASLHGEEPEWNADTPLAESLYGPWTVLTGDGLRLLLKTEAIPPEVLDGTDVANAWFVPHVLQAEPFRLTALTVAGTRLTGAVEIECGYNIDLAAGATAGSVRTSVPVTVAAGAGLGRGLVPCGDADCPRPVRTINKTGPNAAGNYNIEGLDCYNAAAELIESGLNDGVLLTDGVLRLTNACSPCCDCSDYDVVYGEVLGGLVERARTLAERNAALRRGYAKLVADYDRVVACRSRPEVELTLTGMYGRTAAAAMGFRNNSAAPWPAAEEWVEIAVAPASARLVAGSARLYDGAADSIITYEYENGLFRFLLRPVPCCEVRWVAFDLVWDGVGGFVPAQIASSGEIDGIAYDLTAQSATRMPVNRDRTE